MHHRPKNFYYKGDYTVGFFVDEYPTGPGCYRYSVYRSEYIEKMAADRQAGKVLWACYFTKTQTISFTIDGYPKRGFIELSHFEVK